MAVSEVLRALDMLAQQRQRKAYDPLIAADRLGSIIGNIGDKERRYRERDEAQQQSQDFQRQMTLEQEQRRERAAAVAQGQDRLRQIESNRALSDVLGENIPAALDPVAARGYAGDVMRQRGFDARNAAEIEQERIRAQQDAAEAAAKDQAAQAAAMQQRDDRFALASALNLPLVEYGVNGTPLPPPEALKAMASAQEAQAEQARMQRETDPNFKAGELLFKLKQGLPTGLPEGVAPHQYLQEIAPRDANGQMHPDWVTKWVGEFSKMTRPKEDGETPPGPDPRMTERYWRNKMTDIENEIDPLRRKAIYMELDPEEQQFLDAKKAEYAAADAELRSIIGIAPSDAPDNGESRVTPDGKTFKKVNGRWVLDSE